jgi:hypothetical protein
VLFDIVNMAPPALGRAPSATGSSARCEVAFAVGRISAKLVIRIATAVLREIGGLRLTPSYAARASHSRLQRAHNQPPTISMMLPVSVW